MKKLFVIYLLLPFGCQSVPKDAPQEFHEAQAALEAMDKSDSDEVMPKTAKYASNTFSDALDELKLAKDNEGGASVEHATERAVIARDAAKNVTNIHSRIGQWDSNRTTFEQALARLENESADEEIVAVIEPQSPLAKLAGTEIVSTVAYFHTNQFDSPAVVNRELDAMVGILEKSPNYKVTLTGYTDFRGDTAFNKSLAQKRAKNVASLLRNRGVDEKQINVKANGESGIMFKSTKNPGELQLDRRVEATIILQGS